MQHNKQDRASSREEAYNNNFTFYDKPTLRIVPELILCDEQGNIFQVQ